MEGFIDPAAEVREVLTKYLDLFHQNGIVFKYHLAPNSVIDWYGRTVRGAKKIHDYLRHEVHGHFDHMEFSEPKECAPIETKTSHMRTKIISTKPIDNVHPINRVPDMVPLKPYADSDVEDNEQPMSSAFVAVGYRNTPEKCISSLPIADLTPPVSATKDDIETISKKSEDEDNTDEHESRRRRLKRTHSGRFSYLKRLPTGPSTSKRLDRGSDGIRTLLDDSSSEEDDLETMEALYTPLRYLEVNGIMKMKSSSLEGKHKGGIWRDRNQMETRIRISYRRQLEDEQIQFALVIYEPVRGAIAATPTRRNLMSQFIQPIEEPPPQQLETENERSEPFVEETVLETMPTMISIPQTSTSLFDNDIDPLQEEISTQESLTVAQMRTPTKFTNTPPATPKRKPRSLLATTSGLKRLNSSPSAPTAKRSASRSLRL